MSDNSQNSTQASPVTSSGTGSVSTVRIAGLKMKTNMRLQQIARYRVVGRMTNEAIAEKVGLTPSGLQRIIQLPEYKDVENALMEGYISEMDKKIAGNTEALNSMMEQGVPLALRTMIETVQQRRDLRAAMAAAGEILDRDPKRQFTKASRTTDGGTGNKQEFNPGSDTKIVASLAATGNTVAMQIKASGPNPTVAAQVAVTSDSGATDLKAQTDEPLSGADEQPVAPVSTSRASDLLKNPRIAKAVAAVLAKRQGAVVQELGAGD